MVGRGAPKDAKTAFELASKAAEHGDALAMINVAVYFDRGWGTEADKKQAQDWITRAAESGHWGGRLEKGLALLKGLYGFAVDKKAGEQEFRWALELHHREVLEKLALFYAQGIGVEVDGKRAAHFAEAAFVQGSSRAASLLAHLYQEGVGGLAKDEKLKEYWSIQSNPSFAFTLAESLEKMHPEVTQRLKKLDPWSWE
jgi:TPR repeat protein